jgi:hypothetical protein
MALFLDFAAMHDEITTVYVILPVHQLREQSKWLRLSFHQPDCVNLPKA